MLSPNEKKLSNYLGFETESKTKSSSIKDEKEIKMSNKINKLKKKIKRNKTSALNNKNYKNQYTQITTRKKDFNLEASFPLNTYHAHKNDINNKTLQNPNIHFIHKNYNLAEAYLKNNILEKIQKEKQMIEYKRIPNFRTYEYINSINNSNNINFNRTNYINTYNNVYNYNEDQLEEEDFKKYTSSYRYKMINELKTKLNRDTIIDDSLSELQTEKQFMNFLENKNNKNKNSIISKSNKENKFKKVKFVTFKTEENNKKLNTILHSQEINNLSETKNRNINKFFNIIQKNNMKTKKHYLLIKDLLNFKKNKKDKTKNISIKNNNGNSNNVKNKNISQSPRKKNTSKKNISNETTSLSKKNKIYSRRVSGNLMKKGCIIKNNNINDLTNKNSLKNILNKNIKNIKSKSFNRHMKKNKQITNRIMTIYNIKNLIKQ